jgi:acyl dehydratase
MKVPEPRTFGPITRTDIVRYQGASGDMNPIHHDELFAKQAGFPAPVSVGMLQAGYLATYATDWLGAANVRSFRIRFRAPVWPGDVVTCSARVLREFDSADEKLAEVELSCIRQEGTLALTVLASFVIADEAK